jgi:uncharacterized membrane protein HdeD (DUF308 family)
MGIAIADRWWALAIRGLAGVLLGIAAFAWPAITLAVIVILFGAYLLVDGVFALVAGVTGRSWLLILEGVLGIVAGILALLWPAITALVLLFLVAAWAILTGLLELSAAYLLRRVLRREWLLVLAGLASVLFGILLIVNPRAGLLTLVWLTGAYALVFGVILLVLAWRLRRMRGEAGTAPMREFG